jgi:hypothetical protein
MQALYALYDTGDAAQRAVNRLRAAGMTNEEITVISSEPMEAFEFGHIGRPKWFWHIACAASLCGLLFITWFLRFAQQSWPVNTGNMAITAWWPNLIVGFEVTMLSSVLVTVATFLITGKLARRMPPLYDPEVTNGKILVGVENPRPEKVAELEHALLSTPGASLRTV